MNPDLKMKFFIPSSNKMEKLLNDIKLGNHTDETLYQYITDNKEDLALEKSNILNLTATSGKNVCRYIIDNMDEYTAECFNSTMSEGLVLRGINAFESGSVIEALLRENVIYDKLKEDKNYSDLYVQGGTHYGLFYW